MSGVLGCTLVSKTEALLRCLSEQQITIRMVSVPFLREMGFTGLYRFAENARRGRLVPSAGLGKLV